MMCVPCKIEPADIDPFPVTIYNGASTQSTPFCPLLSISVRSFKEEEEEKQTASAIPAGNDTRSQSLAGSTHVSYSHPRHPHQTRTQTHLLLPFLSRSVLRINIDDAPVATTSASLSRMSLNHG